MSGSVVILQCLMSLQYLGSCFWVILLPSGCGLSSFQELPFFDMRIGNVILFYCSVIFVVCVCLLLLLLLPSAALSATLLLIPDLLLSLSLRLLRIPLLLSLLLFCHTDTLADCYFPAAAFSDTSTYTSAIIASTGIVIAASCEVSL